MNSGIISTNIYLPSTILTADEFKRRTKFNEKRFEKYLSHNFPKFRMWNIDENVNDTCTGQIEATLDQVAQHDSRILLMTLSTEEYERSEKSLYADVAKNRLQAKYPNLECVSASATCYGLISLFNYAKYYIDQGLYDFCVIQSISDRVRFLNPNLDLPKMFYSDGVYTAVISKTAANSIGFYFEKVKSDYFKMWQKPFIAEEAAKWHETIWQDQGTIFSDIVENICKASGYSIEQIDYILPPFLDDRSLDIIYDRFNLEKYSRRLLNDEPVGMLPGINSFFEFDEWYHKDHFPGKKVIMLTFGGWFTWNGMLIDFV
jgi:3-oxoacyl-[acyl-carrier-protein] synthase III